MNINLEQNTIMKNFNVNTDELDIQFACPQCGEQVSIHIPAEDMPSPNYFEDTAERSENSEELDVECEVCGLSFTIEVYKNMYEGNVQITYTDEDGHTQEIEDDDIELTEYDSPEEDDEDEF